MGVVHRSLPSRERGLKFKVVVSALKSVNVAPFTGAWIEISVACPIGLACRVAPFTGAWIEIDAREAKTAATQVAPFTGAWIEIVTFCSAHPSGSSLPSRERGLK